MARLPDRAEPLTKGNAIMTAEQEQVIRWAVRFIQNEECQSYLGDLEGTQSMSAPVEFMNLAEAVKQLPDREKYEAA